MRVITGSARGHPLKVPRSAATRPTPARAKEAVFSSLGEAVMGARVLDLFAGSGAFGIEALSRGASRAVFVERDRQACATIRSNLKSTRLEDRASVAEMDVRHILEKLAAKGSLFDIIFADPPYLKVEGQMSKVKCRKSNVEGRIKDSGHSQKNNLNWKEFLLNSIELKAILAPKGILLIEYYKRDSGLESACFKAQKDFRFGDTVITMFSRTSHA